MKFIFVRLLGAGWCAWALWYLPTAVQMSSSLDIYTGTRGFELAVLCIMGFLAGFVSLIFTLDPTLTANSR